MFLKMIQPAILPKNMVITPAIPAASGASELKNQTAMCPSMKNQKNEMNKTNKINKPVDTNLVLVILILTATALDFLNLNAVVWRGNHAVS